MIKLLWQLAMLEGYRLAFEWADRIEKAEKHEAEEGWHKCSTEDCNDKAPKTEDWCATCAQSRDLLYDVVHDACGVYGQDMYEAFGQDMDGPNINHDHVKSIFEKIWKNKAYHYLPDGRILIGNLK